MLNQLNPPKAPQHACYPQALGWYVTAVHEYSLFECNIPLSVISVLLVENSPPGFYFQYLNKSPSPGNCLEINSPESLYTPNILLPCFYLPFLFLSTVSFLLPCEVDREVISVFILHLERLWPRILNNL